MHNTMHLKHLFHSSTQTDCRACLQEPSWTFHIHLSCSQTWHSSLVSSVLGKGRSRNERGLVNTVVVVTAAHRFHWQSDLLLLLCTHCHFMAKKKCRDCHLWVALAPNSKHLWETMMDVPVRSYRPPILKRHGGDNMAPFSQKQAAIFLCALRDLSSFVGGASSWNSHTADCMCGFWIISADPRFGSCRHVPGICWPFATSSDSKQWLHRTHHFPVQRLSCSVDIVFVVLMPLHISRTVTLESGTD